MPDCSSVALVHRSPLRLRERLQRNARIQPWVAICGSRLDLSSGVVISIFIHTAVLLAVGATSWPSDTGMPVEPLKVVLGATKPLLETSVGDVPSTSLRKPLRPDKP